MYNEHAHNVDPFQSQLIFTFYIQSWRVNERENSLIIIKFMLHRFSHWHSLRTIILFYLCVNVNLLLLCIMKMRFSTVSMAMTKVQVQIRKFACAPHSFIYLFSSSTNTDTTQKQIDFHAHICLNTLSKDFPREIANWDEISTQGHDLMRYLL